MEPLSFVRSWIADLHRIGCPLADWTEKEAERVAGLAADAGLPDDLTIALVRDVIRQGLARGAASRLSVGPDLEGVRVVHR